MQTSRLHRPATPNPKRWLGTLLLAIAVFAASTAFFGTVPRLEPPITSPALELLHELDFVLWWEWYALGVVAAVAVATARRQWVPRILALVFAAAAGVGVNLGGVALFNEPTLSFRLGWALVLAVAVTVVFGGAGYLLGRGVRTARIRN